MKYPPKGKYNVHFLYHIISVGPDGTWKADLLPMLSALRGKVKEASNRLAEHKENVAVAEAAVKVKARLLAEATGIEKFHICDETRLQSMEMLYRCELAGLKAYTTTDYPASWESWLGKHDTCRDTFKKGSEDCQIHLPGYSPDSPEKVEEPLNPPTPPTPPFTPPVGDKQNWRMAGETEYYAFSMSNKLRLAEELAGPREDVLEEMESFADDGYTLNYPGREAEKTERGI